MTVKTETNFYKTFKKCLENGTEKYIITRIESYVTPGFPDCLIYHKDIGFFTVELKLRKVKKISFSPHQISFHLRHKKNTFIMVKDLPKALDPLAIKLYEGTKIRELRDGIPGIKPVACGLDACCLYLERV